jgi:HK97 gp10 family phage protein
MAKTGLTMNVSGAKELAASLEQLAKDSSAGTMRNAMKRGMVDAAQPLVDAARRMVPVRTGALRDAIVASSAIDNPVGKAEFGQVLRSGGSKSEATAALRDARRAAGGGGKRITVAVGPAVGKGVSGYAHIVEFGSEDTPPQPYLRPAWDQTQDEVLSRVVDSVGKAVEAAARRAAKKLAKKGR